MQDFYVSTVRFSALMFEIIWKIYMIQFSYQTYQEWRCNDIYDFVNGRASFSAISVTLLASEGDKWCHEYAVRVPQQSSQVFYMYRYENEWSISFDIVSVKHE